MGRIFVSLAAAIAALILTGCDAVTTARVMDPVIRSMASDEQIALYDSVVTALQTDDVEALEALMTEGFPEGFAEEATEYFPNERPSAAYFNQYNFNRQVGGGRSSRSLAFIRIYQFNHGDYSVEMVFLARDDAPYQLDRLSIFPMFEEPASPQTNGAPNDDPI